MPDLIVLCIVLTWLLCAAVCIGIGFLLLKGLRFNCSVTEALWCFRQLDLAPFDRFIWPHPLVNPLSAPGRSEALRSPKGDAFRA